MRNGNGVFAIEPYPNSNISDLQTPNGRRAGLVPLYQATAEASRKRRTWIVKGGLYHAVHRANEDEIYSIVKGCRNCWGVIEAALGPDGDVVRRLSQGRSKGDNKNSTEEICRRGRHNPR